MLHLVALLSVFLSAKAQDLLGIDYSFDVDFYRNFDSKRCDNESAWMLVNYEDLYIDPPFPESGTGIQAAGTSCASSFPIMFFSGSLEFTVNIEPISKHIELIIDVIDETDKSIARYQYGSTKPSDHLGPGWQTININIKKHAKAYINIRGTSLKDDIVLIDSFQYIPNDTINHYTMKAKRSVNYEKQDEAEMIFKYKDPRKIVKHQYIKEEFQGSGNGSGEVDKPEQKSFWNPLTISLVTIGGIAFVGVVAICAYYCGKFRGANNGAQPLFQSDEELPRTLTIPRVTSSYERIMRFD